MRFRQIEAFRCVMLRGTTAAAAAEMHVSQPAISRLISDLEHSLGFMLFERRKGRLHPTLEATEFFRSVEESFLGFERLEAVAEKIRTRVPSELKIASTPAIASSLLPLAIKEHKKYYPDERITLYTENMSQVVVKLQANAVDLGVGLELPNLIGIENEFIGNARFVFAMQAGHALAKKDVIQASDLTGESVLTVMDSDPAYWDKLGHAYKLIKGQIQEHIAIDTAHTGYAMIAEGMAVGVVEPFAARVWRGNNVITRPFEPAVHYSYGLAYPTGTRQHKSLHFFAETIKQVARQMPEFNETVSG
ncbi:LysR family transcriptional regulator [Marinobacterium jannaschii]|uniref:LysR family transcriptional regulator n=1 Tax=Marinobacterium jannaschii TaxID=64970 RepID=UPI00055E9E3F|nr:LysR family transcriptional regulator [Marinobacterium jannaschii]